MKKSTNNRSEIRNKIIGLGENSSHKSYYPQLQQHIQELEKQKRELEINNQQLTDTLYKLESAKAEIAKNEMRYRSLFNNANDAIFIHNAHFNIIDCNDTALKIFPFNKTDLINQHPINFTVEYQLNGMKSADMIKEKTKLAAQGKLQVFDWILKGPSGNIYYTQISLNSIKLGEDTYYQTIIRDYTYTKRLEKGYLNATIQAEETERSRFAKELHDGVGPILSTIKLYFQWLIETDNPKQRKVIIEKTNTNIEEAIRALKEISNNLSPHILINYGLIEALNQFTSVISDTGKLAFHVHHNLTIRLPENLEITLYRVLTELINNTLKYAEASNVTINIQDTNQLISISYNDDGKGITKEKLHKPTGHGLNNIKNRIQNHGGHITFSSIPNKYFSAEITINTAILI